MGPLLFNIYINDIVDATTKFYFIMYADDITLVSHIEKLGTMKIAIEHELNQRFPKLTSCSLLTSLFNTYPNQRLG